MKKRIAACLLLLPLLFSACQNDDDVVTAKGEVEVWSTYATEKILQDNTELYDGVRMPAHVSVEACKGEYEGAQVIMTATKDVASYKAELTSNLVSSSGEVFLKENVSLYHQQYIKIDEAYFNNNHSITGWYPDALLPIDKAVEFGENKIKKGNNQGLYLSFNVPVEQAAGVYSGNLKITYDGQEKLVPIALTVYDLTVSQDTRSLSYFNLGFSQYLGELDGTQNGWRSYVEALIDYRLAPGSVMMQTSPTEESLESYVEEVSDLVVNHGMSTISVAWPWRTGANLSAFLVKLAEKSIELNENLLARTVVKGTDEPKVYDMEKIKKETNDFRAGITQATRKIGELTGATSEFLASLTASVQAIPYIITLQYHRNEETNAAGIDTYCPYFSYFHTESDRALYEDQWKGRWWYGCSGPQPPYPSYHIDDTLVSARSIGWMMSEYDVVGNLYWSATVYAEYDGVKYSPSEDLYDKADRYPRSNGDGFLFYPGSPYGMDEPIASLRLESIRDGNEEYELLYDLKEAYEAAGYSFADVQRSVSELIYSGVIVQYDNASARFAEARRAMIQLAMLAKEGVFITDVANDQKGNITYQIVADKDYVLKESGRTLTGTVDGESANYTLVMPLDKDNNVLKLSVDTGENVYSLWLGLGGKVTYKEADDLYAPDLFTNGNAKVRLALEGDKIRIDVGAVNGKHQSVRSDIFRAIDGSVQKLVLKVENPTQEAMNVRILVRLEGYLLNTELYSGTLQPGENLVEIDFSGMQINGKISYSDFYFSNEEGDHAAKTICLQSLTVYYK